MAKSGNEAGTRVSTRQPLICHSRAHFFRVMKSQNSEANNEAIQKWGLGFRMRFLLTVRKYPYGSDRQSVFVACVMQCDKWSPLKAYANWIERNGEEPTLPALEMTNHQLFFVGFAQVCVSLVCCLHANVSLLLLLFMYGNHTDY